MSLTTGHVGLLMKHGIKVPDPLEVFASRAAKDFANTVIAGYARYEFVRRLTPRQFADLCQENLSTCVPFDELVDRKIDKELGV